MVDIQGRYTKYSVGSDIFSILKESNITGLNPFVTSDMKPSWVVDSQLWFCIIGCGLYWTNGEMLDEAVESARCIKARTFLLILHFGDLIISYNYSGSTAYMDRTAHVSTIIADAMAQNQQQGITHYCADDGAIQSIFGLQSLDNVVFMELWGSAIRLFVIVGFVVSHQYWYL